MIDLNMRALTALSLMFLPSLERHRGGILNVGSMAGFMPGPGMAVYYASKAYVLSFTDSLRSELKRPRRSRHQPGPGPVPTEFGERAGVRRHAARPADADGRAGRRAGYRGLMQGKALVVPGGINGLACAGAFRAARAVAGGGRAAAGARKAALNRMTFHAAVRLQKPHKPASSDSRRIIIPPCRIRFFSSCIRSIPRPAGSGRCSASSAIPLDIRRPRFGDPLPETMDAHTGAVIFGGPQSANDEEDSSSARSTGSACRCATTSLTSASVSARR